MALNDGNQITMDNLDELEVHLTIVAKNPQSVKSISAFLGRRDWPTKVISNANEAIESITKDKPDIVLLSFNHPQLNVEKFATLLSQTLNMTCVGFCESEDRISIAKLQASKLRYKLVGGSSGPTIHRFVRKVLIEKYGLNITESDSSKTTKDGTAGKEEDSDIVIAGKSGRYGKTSVLKGEQLDSDSVNVGPGFDDSYNGSMVVEEGADSLEHFEIASGGGDGAYAMPMPTPNQKKKRLSAVTKTKVSTELRGQTKENLSSQESTLQNSMSEIFQNITQESTELGSHPDDPVEWIGILPVIAKDFHGYLAIPVKTQPNVESEQMLQKIKESIGDDLEKKGFSPKIEDGFFIQIDPTYFSSLAKGHAQFILQQGISDEAELCVSYFSSSAPTQPIKKVNKTMSTIRVDGVSTENPINFKVYLHLNKNKKYFLYLNTGRTLSGKQKTKLHNRGIKSFFIKNTEVENFKKYLATSFVKQLIVSLKEELTADEQGQEKNKEENSA